MTEKIYEFRLSKFEAQALVEVANYALLDAEGAKHLNKRRARMALKRMITAMGYVPEDYAGMVNFGRKAPQ